MSQEIEVFDQDEIDAIKSGELEGTVYSDGEAWANRVSLINFRNSKTQGEANVANA